MTEKDTLTPPDNTSAPVEAAPSGNKIPTIWVVLGVVFFLFLIALIIVAVNAMVKNPAQTETLRDIMIIFLAFESIIIGLALVILLVQLARLTNLLQYEIRPILEATNETVGSLRGTTKFLSDNLVTPVVKANSSFAALRRAIELFDFRRTK
jgi:ABC-type dipeptide/oligopeptide/nickel transport system permease component